MLELHINTHRKEEHPLPPSFLKEVLFFPKNVSLQRHNREYALLETVLKDLRKGRLVCCVARWDKQPVGLIALSTTRIGKHPALMIDYLFVSYPFRQSQLKKVSNPDCPNICDELLIKAHESAKEIQKLAGLTHLTLEPDMESLKPLYQDRYGFVPLSSDPNWLFMRIDQNP